jgi:hypothetical protein
MRLIHKLSSFSEWYDVDGRLSDAIAQGAKHRAALANRQGKSFVSSANNQPELVQICLTKCNGILAQTQDPLKVSDESIGKVRQELGGLKLLDSDIRAKRKAA